MENRIESGEIGLGLLRPENDPASIVSFRRPMALMAPKDRPKAIDPRAIIPIENQGPVGSCAGHALALCGTLCILFATGRLVRLSRMWCYLQGQKKSGLFGRDVGSSIFGCVQAAHDVGICREEAFPYPGRYETRIPAAAIAEAVEHTIRSNCDISSYDEAFAFLSNGIGGIQIGIDWVTSLANNTSGVIDTLGGRSLGGHSVALCGYSDRIYRDGRNYLILGNSHSTDWGRGGWAEVAPPVIDQWLRGGGNGYGLSDMEDFARRELDLSSFS